MKANIEYHQAVQLSREIQEQETQAQKEALEDFLESKCDMFSSQDWQYYAQATGKSISWLMQNASYYDDLGAYGTMLDNAIKDGDFELGEQFI